MRANISPRKLETDSLPRSFQEAPLGSFCRWFVLPFVLASLACAAPAQSKATLDVSEALFSVVAAMNVCGYDQELQSSSPIRMEVRADLLEASKAPAVATAAKQMCQFYRDHQQSDAAHDLAQYVSLALYLGPPPDFALLGKESDIPPDSNYVLGFLPLLKQYYAAANLHSIWLKHQPEYLALIDRYHEPVARMITSTDTYLRMPFSGYLGRSFTVYLEPMSAPGQVNSRNYLQDYYYLVISPSGENIHIEALRHTYLHYVLDPLIAKRATALQRLKPILVAVQKAPMAEDYKLDPGLLVVECLIRAIEVRPPFDPKLPDKERQAMLQRDEAEGFVFTRLFYDDLRDFEKENTGLQDAFPDWLHNIDVDHEKRRVSQIEFASQAAPELMRAAKPASQQKVDLAERQLVSGDPAGAQKLAEEALNEQEDPARAYFVLARAATMSGNMQGAQENFQKALEAAKDPHIAAWCHIYLGRILDLQDERENALAQYQAALSAGDPSPDTQKAAERGLKEPYQPPNGKREQ